MPDDFVLDYDFDSESDGECRPLIGKDHASDSDGGNSGNERVDENDFDPHSRVKKSSSQAL